MALSRALTPDFGDSDFTGFPVDLRGFSIVSLRPGPAEAEFFLSNRTFPYEKLRSNTILNTGGFYQIAPGNQTIETSI